MNRKYISVGVVASAIAMLALAETAFAGSDGDHDVRPRPEYRGVQAQLLRTARTPVDKSMAIEGATTVNFGFVPYLYAVLFDQHAEWGVYYDVPQGGE